MKKRCRHNEVRVCERRWDDAAFDFKDGVIVDDFRIDGFPTGSFFVRCNKCGFEKTYRKSKSLPQWVAKLIDVIENGPREDG